MSGVIVHVIKRVSPDPSPPEHWAFTGLRNFQVCPRRWFLSHCHFDKFGGPLPPRLTKAGVEGDLLHALLECYYDRRRDRTEMFRPRKVLLGLIEDWYQKNKANARSDAWRVRHQVSTPDILSQFWKAVDNCGQVALGAASTAVASSVEQRVAGTEVWLCDDRSKLVGRCDLIKDDRLVDFKSGEPHDWHRDQVLFYASLLYAKSGYLVKSAELLYLDSFQPVVVAMPSADEMEATLCRYRSLAAQADELIALDRCDARPDETECQKCPVRMLCSVYCQGEASRRVFARQPEDGLVDFICEQGEVLLEAAGAVVKIVSDRGTRSLFFPMPLVLRVGTESLTKLRVMNVAITSSEDGKVVLSLTSASEAFIVAGVV